MESPIQWLRQTFNCGKCGMVLENGQQYECVSAYCYDLRCKTCYNHQTGYCDKCNKKLIYAECCVCRVSFIPPKGLYILSDIICPECHIQQYKRFTYRNDITACTLCHYGVGKFYIIYRFRITKIDPITNQCHMCNSFICRLCKTTVYESSSTKCEKCSIKICTNCLCLPFRCMNCSFIKCQLCNDDIFAINITSCMVCELHMCSKCSRYCDTLECTEQICKNCYELSCYCKSCFKEDLK